MSSRRLSTWIPLLVFVGLVLLCFIGLHRNPHIVPSALIGQPIPEINSQRLYQPDQRITNKDFLGHVTLLNVFASWCEVCHDEHPYLMDISNQHVVALYGLNYKDDSTQAKSMLKADGNPYAKIISDPLGQLAINFGVYGTPETFLIDAKGVIRDKIIGEVTLAIWRQKLLPEILALRKVK